jgi:predicted metal-dependent phosphoesterase TrpH
MRRLFKKSAKIQTPVMDHRVWAKGPKALCVDMHIHSSYSDAPGNTLETIVNKCRENKVGAAICDHNEIRGSVLLTESRQVLSIPAIEVGTSERLEFIAYFRETAALEEFYRKEVEPFKRSRFYAKLDRSFSELIPAAKEHGALVCLPHPFGPSYKNVNFGRKRKAALFNPDLFSNIDLIEVTNGHLPDSRNYRAYMLSELFDKSASAGSDAHRPAEIGNVYLRFDKVLDSKGVFDHLLAPKKVGIAKPYRVIRFAKTARNAAPTHLQLYFSRKHQQRWMSKYGEAAVVGHAGA